jgi:hypothetical protein
MALFGIATTRLNGKQWIERTESSSQGQPTRKLSAAVIPELPTFSTLHPFQNPTGCQQPGPAVGPIDQGFPQSLRKRTRRAFHWRRTDLSSLGNRVFLWGARCKEKKKPNNTEVELRRRLSLWPR